MSVELLSATIFVYALTFVSTWIWLCNRDDNPLPATGGFIYGLIWPITWIKIFIAVIGRYWKWL